MKLVMVLLFMSIVWTTVTDIDGNIYETVIIGDNLWMQENLKVTHYRNGDEIPNITNNAEWGSLTGQFGVYNNDPELLDYYGGLYNWYAVDDDRGICPEGWHVATEDEFITMINYIGIENSGGKMKECTFGSCPESEYWNSPNTGATNESGFTAIPGGFRNGYGGNYCCHVTDGYFWSSTGMGGGFGWQIESDHGGLTTGGWNKQNGKSVRCVADESHEETILVPHEYPTIQAGIDASMDGDNIFVSQGIYLENINFNGKKITITGDNRETTIIDGIQNGSVVTFDSGEDSTAILTGFTITNGLADNGGGVYCNNSSPTLSNLIINFNTASLSGGGIRINSNSNPTMTNVIIESNNANFGGGIYHNGSSFVISKSLIIDNSSISHGGAIFDNAPNLFLKNVTITNNSGGMINGIYNYGSSLNLVNCIILDESYLDEISVTASYSNLLSGWQGDGNIDVDPLFTDPENGDFTLKPFSPCIDVGDPDLDGDGINWDTDIDDQDPDSTRLDIGAYYFDQIENPLVEGCTDSDACNFNQNANISDGSCEYPDYAYNCQNNCLYDWDEDGICDVFENTEQVIDIDGNIYETVQIGEQLWMQENLKVTHYKNGDSIPNILNGTEWGNLSSGSFGNYNNDTNNVEIYGKLYNWFAVDDERGICPENWHVPTNNEWTILSYYLGGNNISGGKMKSLGTIEAGNGYWFEPNTGASNVSGFSALPGGYRLDTNGNFYEYLNYTGYFWTSTEFNSSKSYRRRLSNIQTSNFQFDIDKNFGYSVRCIKDIPGCTDIDASNYDPDANIDDGSCEYFGCTDGAAYNFNPNALNDDGSCLYECQFDNPVGCIVNECIPGYACVDDNENNCVPSSCECNESVGEWVCTEDCNGGTCISLSLIGDVNHDENVNVVDVVIFVWIILDESMLTLYEDWASDINKDGENNILDVVLLVEIILDIVIMDIDGNYYTTVEIGEQIWLAENLKVTHYRNGDEIPTGFSYIEWVELHLTSTGAFAAYNDDNSNADIYGNLYNWYAVNDNRGICPSGWHIPSEIEFIQLEMYLGMSEEEANSLNSRGTNEGSKLGGNDELWNDGNLENNSEFGASGFSGIPGGIRWVYSFQNLEYMGYFWSSTAVNENNWEAWFRRLTYNSPQVFRYWHPTGYGLSVRCIKD